MVIKIKRYQAWFDTITRTLWVRWCCRTVIRKSGKNKGKKVKLGKYIPVQTPRPDVLYNQSVYNYLISWIYENDYRVYVLHDTRLRYVGVEHFDVLRIMLDDLLDDYFNTVSGMKCRVSPMAMFSLYDFRNALKHKRKIAILSLDETKFTCVQIATKPFFDGYFA